MYDKGRGSPPCRKQTRDLEGRLSYYTQPYYTNGINQTDTKTTEHAMDTNMFVCMALTTTPGNSRQCTQITLDAALRADTRYKSRNQRPKRKRTAVYSTSRRSNIYAVKNRQRIPLTVPSSIMVVKDKRARFKRGAITVILYRRPPDRPNHVSAV